MSVLRFFLIVSFLTLGQNIFACQMTQFFIAEKEKLKSKKFCYEQSLKIVYSKCKSCQIIKEMNERIYVPESSYGNRDFLTCKLKKSKAVYLHFDKSRKKSLIACLFADGSIASPRLFQL